MRSILPRVVPFAALALLACKPDVEEPAGGPTPVDALGVIANLPPGWSHQEKRGEHWLSKSAFYGGRLTKTQMPASLDAAIGGWLTGDVVDEGEAPGMYWAVIEAEFPDAGGGDPMRLPHVFVVVAIGDAAVECGGQLQAGDDPGPLLQVCKSLKAS